jgi:hypothetical protein
MDLVETFCLAGLFAAMFVFGEELFAGHRIHQRRALSVAGGAAVAYVFVRLFAELPGEKDGRFVPFCPGAVAYAVLLFFA